MGAPSPASRARIGPADRGPAGPGADAAILRRVTTLPAELLEILVCPKCKGDLVPEQNALRCDACRLRYRVDDGIPVMLIDEATPLGDEETAAAPG